MVMSLLGVASCQEVPFPCQLCLTGIAIFHCNTEEEVSHSAGDCTLSQSL